MYARLLRTAFLTALLSYLGFMFVDYLEPGFVSNVFSVHIVGALALILGVMWYPVAVRAHRHTHVVPILIGVIAACIVWNEGAMFGDFRGLLAAGVLVLPWCTARLLSQPVKIE